MVAFDPLLAGAGAFGWAIAPLHALRGTSMIHVRSPLFQFDYVSVPKLDHARKLPIGLILRSKRPTVKRHPELDCWRHEELDPASVAVW